MKGSENKLLQLTRLLETGTLARSACSREFFATLAPLLDSDVVIEDRAGAGRRLVVRDPHALRDFIQHRFPNAPVSAGASSRVAGVSRFRDTKAVASDLPEIVTIRAWHGDALKSAGKSIAAAEATHEHGVFSFLLQDAARYTLHGSCALVENPAMFTQFEHLGLTPHLALYGHGRSSNRLLDWLAAQIAPDFQLLHLPDYDPVGLDEFIRLQEKLGPRVRLHLPENLADLFARHGNRELLQKPSTQTLLARLRRHLDKDVCAVLALIENHNAGLEQEALLIRQNLSHPETP
jgi:hypothetical protein